MKNYTGPKEMDTDWTARAKKRDMAYINTPLAELPDQRLIYEDDLDIRLGEGLRLLAGYAAIILLIVGIIVLLSLPGN